MTSKIGYYAPSLSPQRFVPGVFVKPLHPATKVALTKLPNAVTREGAVQLSAKAKENDGSGGLKRTHDQADAVVVPPAV